MASTMAKKALLITGATGTQGGSVIKAVNALPNAQDFVILAVTRNATSEAAQRLKRSYSNLKVVQGDMKDAHTLFQSAQTALADSSAQLWGVFSVQAVFGKGWTPEVEEEQGRAIIKAAEIAGVQHFVQTSVDRGGEPRSNDNPTYVPHFMSKHNIEQALKVSKLTSWTILRPVAFMDNFAPGMQTKVFLSALRQQLAENKPLQFIAACDIGWFAAQAFAKPDEYRQKAIGLAGDELTFRQLNTAWRNATGSPAPVAWSFLGKVFMLAVKEMGLMIKWFKEEGYGVDIAGLRQVHPELMTLEAWLKTESKF